MANNKKQFSQDALPHIYGPVKVEVHTPENLIILLNTSDLLEVLTPDECMQLQRELQSILNWFCEEKNIPHV